MMRLTSTACLLVFLTRSLPAEVDYERDIRPLLAVKCAGCHGPVKQEGGLRLDAGRLARQGGDSGPVASASDGDNSLLLRRVTSEAPEDRMPPASEGAPLTAEQVNLLRQWIAAGLPSPENEAVLAGVRDHWAYQPISKPALPGQDVADGPSHPIDRLLARHYSERQLTALPPTDPATLLRRVTFDLTGLPPTLEEQRAFLADPSPEHFARIVDKLLARPQFGERWARHWMDVWRYSDWDGYKQELRGSQRHIWQWRDWIVESLDAGKPYDRMVVEMLAGDELAPTDPQTLRATGFLARSFHASNRNIWLDATVEHTAKAFLGMTLNCARCHDHKYDPLVVGDYYAFRAIFEPYKVRTDRLPGEADLKKAGLARVYDADLEAATYVYLRGDEKHPDKEHPVTAGVPELLGVPFEVEPVELPPLARFPSLADHVAREDLAAAETRAAALRAERNKLAAAGQASSQPAAAAAGRPASPLPTIPLDPKLETAERAVRAAEMEVVSLKARWAADMARYGETPSKELLETLAVEASQQERAHALAVAERDVWTALLKDRESRQSRDGDARKRQDAIQKATDELAKAQTTLEKARANAAKRDDQYTAVGPVYPAVSTGRRLALARWIVDPRNPLTARVAVNQVWMRHFGRPIVDNVFDFGLRTPEPPLRDVLDWLAADLIDSGWNLKHLHRQIITSQAYQRASSAETSWLAHNESADPDNLLWWRADVRRLEAEVVRDSLLAVAGRLDGTLGGPDLDHSEGEKIPRRSLYFRHAYEKQMTMLTTFDAANPVDCYRRTISIVPQQALALSNSNLSVSMSRAYVAERLKTGAGQSDAEFVEEAFLRLLGRTADSRESEVCVEFLRSQQQLLASPGALEAIASPTQAAVPPSTAADQRARENLVHVLMNHNDFVTVR